MHRRRFLQQTGSALAVAPFRGAFDLARAFQGASKPIPDAVLNRIGITTVCFRDRFPATRSKGAAAPAGGDLTLLTAPNFIADELGLHNVEIWSAQFADKSLDYCKQVKAAAETAGSRIINLQVDGPENLSDPDPAKRAASLASIKQWMDRAAAVGSPRMRANTGGGLPEAWDVNRTADSFRQLAEYGKTIGVKILLENHPATVPISTRSCRSSKRSTIRTAGSFRTGATRRRPRQPTASQG
jgi:Xylose isomerase-like TIM barrel